MTFKNIALKCPLFPQVLTESNVFDVISTIHQDWFPHLLQGSVLVVGEIAHLKAKCWSWWGEGRSLPTQYPLGYKPGESQVPNGHCAHPLPLDSLPGQVATWEGRASCRLPMAWRGGSEMPAPLALPILLASKFLSNTFWGFPQPPPQILAGRSGFPLLFPKEGPEQDRKLAVFKALHGKGRCPFRYLPRMR